MESVEIRLNNFLFNSGVLGLYTILRNVEKEDKVQINGNALIVEKEAFDNFEEDYIKTMLNTFEEDTKWHTIINRKEKIRRLDMQEQEDIEQLEENYKSIKRAMDSASYKSGYEIIKNNTEEDPYILLEQIKKEKDKEKQKTKLIKVIEHIEAYKEIYCMKDIIYTKINCFWENVAFLNRTSNKKEIKEEYKKVFVTPVQEYLKKSSGNDYNCIECGTPINKSEATGMSWLKDVGVDINRKKSGFWNFKEDTFLCPVCNLIYSCVPLGFCMVGSNGIFINNNDSFHNLKASNSEMKLEKEDKVDTFNHLYYRILTKQINRMNQLTNEKKAKYEPDNIQVIKRLTLPNKQIYEFNLLAKDKLKILERTATYFERLVTTTIYQKVLDNVIEGRRLYSIIAELIEKRIEMRAIYYVLKIEANTMIGGENVEEREQEIEEMIREGERLQAHFYANKENKNKLNSFSYKLQGALKANNVNEFMKLFTLFYGSMNIKMPKGKAITHLIGRQEDFRLYGYAYIYGLGKKTEQGGKEDEE